MDLPDIPPFRKKVLSPRCHGSAAPLSTMAPPPHHYDDVLSGVPPATSGLVPTMNFPHEAPPTLPDVPHAKLGLVQSESLPDSATSPKDSFIAFEHLSPSAKSTSASTLAGSPFAHTTPAQIMDNAPSAIISKESMLHLQELIQQTRPLTQPSSFKSMLIWRVISI
ncbi:unnamed protein product [Brassica oleracea]